MRTEDVNLFTSVWTMLWRQQKFLMNYKVRKGVSPPIPFISKSLLGSTPFLKIPHPPSLATNSSSLFGHRFSLSTETTVKLSSVNTIHVKQQQNVGFFIFKFTLKHMLGNVYINKIHARQCLYIISLYCRECFSHPFNFFVVSKGIPQV